MSSAGYRTKNELAEAAKRADANRANVALLKTVFYRAPTEAQRLDAYRQLRAMGIDPLAEDYRA